MKTFIEIVKWTDENNKELSNVAVAILVGVIGVISLLLDHYFVSTFTIILLSLSFITLCTTIFFGFIFHQNIAEMEKILIETEKNKELTMEQLKKMNSTMFSKNKANKTYHLLQRTTSIIAVFFLMAGSIIGFTKGEEKEQIRHDKLLIVLGKLDSTLNTNLNTLSHQLDTLNVKLKDSSITKIIIPNKKK